MIYVKKNMNKPSALLAVLLSVVLLLGAFPVAVSAAELVEYYYPENTTFVSEIAFARSGYWGIVNLNSTKEKLTDAGYNALDWDFNEGCGTNSDWIAGGWKTSTDASRALRDIKFWYGDSDNKPQYYDRTVNGTKVRYYLVGGTYEPNSVEDGGVVDLNNNAGGKYIYAYITRDPAAGPPITDIKFNDERSVSGYTTCTSFQEPNNIMDLNKGAGGDDLFMHWTHNSTVVNLKKLRAYHAKAQKMVPNKTNYTVATYEPLKIAYDSAALIVNAFDVCGAASITQSRIDTAYNALKAAVDGAQTNVYFDASTNGGKTSLSSLTVTIGENDTCPLDLSSYTVTKKGGWKFIGWNKDKTATEGEEDENGLLNVGFNETYYAIFGKNLLINFNYLDEEGNIVNEAKEGKIYNNQVQKVFTAPSPKKATYNDTELKFLGWRTDARALAPTYTANTVTVQDGIVYSFRAIYSSEVKLTFDANCEDVTAPIALTQTKYYNIDEEITEKSVKFTLPETVLTRTGYGFLGWSTQKDATTAEYAPGDILENVNKDTVLYAVWSHDTYSVVFKNYDGKVLQTQEAFYGDMPEYTGDTPVKPGTVAGKWVFDGWDKEFEKVTGACEYTATFRSETADYEVKFVNDDGKVLQNSMVDYLGMPEYTGDTPKKTADAQYTYTFAGWDKEFEEVKGAQTYTATYTETLNSYSVKFVNYDGTVLQEGTYDYGTLPEYTKKLPTKQEDAQYTYAFSKWDKKIAEVTGEVVYTAQFENTVKSYEIKFINYDGTPLYTTKVNYGETPVYGSTTPTKAEDAQYKYIFSGWTPKITSVTGTAVYKAQFESKEKMVTVTFFNYDGNVLESKFVAYGTTPVYTGTTPVKNATAEWSYTFTGWDKEIVAATDKAEYTACYTPVKNKYTVQFKNFDGTVLQSEVLEYGSAVSYKGETPVKAADASSTYIFTGWNKQIKDVTGAAEYTAVFKAVSNTYTVVFCNADGTVLESKAYAYGSVPVYGGATPTKAYDNGYHYTFKGWDKEITKVSATVTYVAEYTATPHAFGEPVQISAASCTSNGKYTCYCECGYSYDITENAYGHNYKYSVDGDKAYKTCQNCGDTIEVPMEEVEENPDANAEQNLCKYCGKYHYKYIFPDLGFISCLISRIFTFFAELFAGKTL